MMAKVTIDQDLCTGCGVCESSCPEVFEIRDDNLCYVKSENFEGCDLKSVASECPVEAIKVEE